MIVPKVEIINSSDAHDLQNEINEFLSDMDVRQIVKMEYSNSRHQYNQTYSCLIMYIGLDDVRDIKIETVLSK
jgi:hypothetical protein